VTILFYYFTTDTTETIRIRYDSVYLTCSEKLMGSQLSRKQGTNKNKNVKLKIKR